MYIGFVDQQTAYAILRSDWSSDVCSSDLVCWLACWLNGSFIDWLVDLFFEAEDGIRDRVLCLEFRRVLVRS